MYQRAFFCLKELTCNLKILEVSQKPNDINDQTILLAAMDWGMGHTTRCVSIISKLLDNNNKVVFAGNNKQNEFIRNEFPNVKLEQLDGYNISLDSSKNTYLQVVKQGRNIQKAIRNEQKWLNIYLEKRKVDLIISDNRYGFYHSMIPSILMTHQLNLQVPSFKYFANYLLKSYVNKFNTVWVPDDVERTLTGELSNAKLKIPVHFIGLLNRFEKVKAEKKYDCLVILSGPEPERTNFTGYAKQHMLELGVTASFVGAEVHGFDSFKSPTTSELELLIAQSDTVYSRAGYTTIMEMIGLNKKAVLYPTNGQYEQEYLAKYIQHSKLKFSYSLAEQ